ncbi:hypothetical protein GCM10022215_00140 [Nocardioides fonticola]|uniref:Uncharacterized protein n=1 Tax=Nocardioides fonticola TaxID=450363 RepID=A0ABP7X976_9ACTN|nr:hypothetical protein [Nocardioides sp.]
MNSTHAWQALAKELTDALWLGAWFLYGGLVACGACWCVGYGGARAWEEWDHDWVRRREQRRIDREAARGLRAIEEFLQRQIPASSNALDGEELPSAAKGHRRRRRQP